MLQDSVVKNNLISMSIICNVLNNLTNSYGYIVCSIYAKIIHFQSVLMNYNNITHNLYHI